MSQTTAVFYVENTKKWYRFRQRSRYFSSSERLLRSRVDRSNLLEIVIGKYWGYRQYCFLACGVVVVAGRGRFLCSFFAERIISMCPRSRYHARLFISTAVQTLVFCVVAFCLFEEVLLVDVRRKRFFYDLGCSLPACWHALPACRYGRRLVQVYYHSRPAACFSCYCCARTSLAQRTNDTPLDPISLLSIFVENPYLVFRQTHRPPCA